METKTKLKLYGMPISHPTRSIMWLCSMKEFSDYDLVVINPYIPTKYRKNDDYYFKNIRFDGKIPAIKDTNGLILFEGAAIMQYLCTKFKWNSLYPSNNFNLKRRAKIDEYLHWHHGNTRMLSFGYLAPILMVKKSLDGFIKNDNLLQKRKIAYNAMKILNDKILGTSQLFIVDNLLSIADIFCYEEIVQIYIWDLMNENVHKLNDNFIDEQFPNISNWIKRMRSLPNHNYIHSKMFDLKYKKYQQRKREIAQFFAAFNAKNSKL